MSQCGRLEGSEVMNLTRWIAVGKLDRLMRPAKPEADLRISNLTRQVELASRVEVAGHGAKRQKGFAGARPASCRRRSLDRSLRGSPYLWNAIRDRPRLFGPPHAREKGEEQCSTLAVVGVSFRALRDRARLGHDLQHADESRRHARSLGRFSPDRYPERC